MQNTTTQWRRATQSFRKIYLSLYLKGLCVWEGVGDRTELQYIYPHSNGHQRLFLSFQGCSTGGPGPPLLGAGFLYHILSPTGLKTYWLPVFTELYNSSIAHSISSHNWPSGFVTFAVLVSLTFISLNRSKSLDLFIIHILSSPWGIKPGHSGDLQNNL